MNRARTAYNRPMTLDVNSHRDGDAGVVVAAGEIDLTSSEQLRTVLQETEAGEPAHVVIDLRQVDFIDSTGLSVLVGAANKERDTGRTIDLVAHGHVRELLRVTGLDTIMGVHPDLASALDRTGTSGSERGTAAGPVAG
jgi:anti-sigma B factor antagonist